MRATSQLPARCAKATASCTALDYCHALATPIGLADDIGASIHAIIREYVKRHPNPTGLVRTGRMVCPHGTVPLCCAIQSPSFRDWIGPVTRILAADGLLLRTSSGGELRAVDDVISRARSSVDSERRTITTTDVNGNAIELDVEAFDNHYNLFVTLTPTGACDSAAGSIWPRRHPRRQDRPDVAVMVKCIRTNRDCANVLRVRDDDGMGVLSRQTEYDATLPSREPNSRPAPQACRCQHHGDARMSTAPRAQRRVAAVTGVLAVDRRDP